jgi:hypothetical protein
LIIALARYVKLDRPASASGNLRGCRQGDDADDGCTKILMQTRMRLSFRHPAIGGELLLRPVHLPRGYVFLAGRQWLNCRLAIGATPRYRDRKSELDDTAGPMMLSACRQMAYRCNP